jgi:putative membrane protein
MSHTRINPALRLCSIMLVSLSTGACMMGGMGGMSPAMMQSESAMHHFTMAVHMGEIEEAQLALSKTSNPQVREFAQRMVTEHTAAMQREQQMMARMGMNMGMNMDMDMERMRAVLMENPYSRPVVEDHMRAMQMLQGMSGMAFDGAYMNRQVAAHRYALENLDRMMSSMGMTPGGAMAGQSGADMNAGNMDAGMRGGREERMMMHQNLRAMIASHLQMAQQMMDSMRSM